MRHGGDLSQAIADYGGTLSDWLDLSTGINPHAWPVDPRLLTDVLHHLPTRAEEEALLDAARQAYRVPENVAIVAATGAQAAIQWLPHLASQGDVAIFGPTYSEHALSWHRAGHGVAEINDMSALPQTVRHAVIVNPNNPDGRILSLEKIAALAKEMQRRDGWLVTDESFADVNSAISCSGLCGELPIIVLRSFGKFFGLPGLRLGFLIAAPEIAASFLAALGPWSVSTPALIIGAHALKDRTWAETTRIKLTDMAARLDEVLTTSGLKVSGGTSLFRLAHHPDAKAQHERLARKHIWCRRFEEDDTRLRFGLPRDTKDLNRLKEALQSL